MKIIGYHYVHNKNQSISKNFKSLSVKAFRDQIKFIKKNYYIITLQELILETKIPKNSLLLTFDDGYLDHYENVFPILCKEKVSGVFFAPGLTLNQIDILNVNKIQIFLHNYQDKKKLFNEICKEIICLGLNVDYYLKLMKKLANPNDLRWHDKYSNNIRNFLQYILPKRIRDEIINKFFQKNINLSKKEILKKLYLNKNQAKEMIANGMFFGAHGYDHEWFEHMSYNDQLKDIKKSKTAMIEIGVKKNILTICYPFGSYNKNTIQILKRLDFKLGFANFPQNVINFKNQKFQLPRFDTNELI